MARSGWQHPLQGREQAGRAITNLEYVTIKEAMQNFEVWVTDWDLPLTKKEKNVVMQENWRAGLYLSVGG